MPFEKGHTIKGGRKKGSKNRVTNDARQFAQSFLEDPEYQQSVRERLASKSPQWQWLEELVWAYGYGKPVERQQIEESSEQTVNTNLIDFRSFYEEHDKEHSSNGHSDSAV